VSAPPAPNPGSPAPPDPARPLRAAASVILVRRDPTLEVLWVVRSEANPFLGGFHSFPGGRLSREDGAVGSDAEAARVTLARCAARETFEEIGLLLGFVGEPPSPETQRAARERMLAGSLEFWPEIERWGLTFQPSALNACGRWITPHMSLIRFDTTFFLAELDGGWEPDVWPGELASGEWIEPKRALALWMEDEVTLAMPTLHAIRVLAAGGHGLPARLCEIPEANGVPSRHVEVRRGITMIPLRSSTLAPATHTNAVVIGESDAVIVDPGSDDPGELEALASVVERAIASGGRVIAILLTHPHKDHIAGVESVRARYGAPVWGHPLLADRVRLDRAIGEGERIEVRGPKPRVVRALATPGHSRSHLAYYEETSRTLCAGDLLSGFGTVVIAPPDGNLRDYLSTLERLRGLGALAAIPGHGSPIRAVERSVEAVLEHRRMREARILRALRAGPMALPALQLETYRDTPGAPPGLAARTLEAHLEMLIEDGVVRRDGDQVALAARG
jgi:glyoxylase-like metal-dependent hydrolase (beta-lactamase superfamily II)/8-oxo-dGTP pyrophosphatase MutT (NUDIX family)